MGKKLIPTRIMDLEALGEFIYGKQWRTETTQWNMLIELAAAKQVHHVLKKLVDVMLTQGVLPETIELTVSKNDKKVTSIHPRLWSDQTDREVKTRCAAMLMELLEEHGVTVHMKDGQEESAAELR